MQQFLFTTLCVSLMSHTFAFMPYPYQICHNHLCQSESRAARIANLNDQRLMPHTAYNNKRHAKIMLRDVRMNGRTNSEARGFMGFRNNMFYQNGLQIGDMGWLVPAIAVGVWLALATLLFEKIEGWQPGESFFYVIDTGLCRGFGSVKPATALGQVRYSCVASLCTRRACDRDYHYRAPQAATIANELFGASAAAVLLGQFAQRILENAKESGAVAKVKTTRKSSSGPPAACSGLALPIPGTLPPRLALQPHDIVVCAVVHHDIALFRSTHGPERLDRPAGRLELPPLTRPSSPSRLPDHSLCGRRVGTPRGPGPTAPGPLDVLRGPGPKRARPARACRARMAERRPGRRARRAMRCGSPPTAARVAVAAAGVGVAARGSWGGRSVGGGVGRWAGR